HRQFGFALDGVIDRACGRYEELFRRLAADFPEVACWANLRDHQATRTEVRNLGIALTDLERTLTEISNGSVPDERRTSLARAYQAELQRPIVESGDVLTGLRIPALGEAYVTPRFRLQQVDGGARPSEESWWENIPIRDDLDDFFIGYLTSPLAREAPLLVLGQPGSGKSVLTRVLAARLPAPDFLPVRVVLREVPAAADLQDQIEHAIRKATGERLDWPALVRSAGDALPVVLLDGFDELLQATGVSQTDYLAKVATFQRREEEQGRPVAVVVTSRTSVADRARPPEDLVALRLEPFDADRVTAWLETWNAVNAGHFVACGLGPLSPEVVLAHRVLAEQPLLLLMLALYDAAGTPCSGSRLTCRKASCMSGCFAASPAERWSSTGLGYPTQSWTAQSRRSWVGCRWSRSPCSTGAANGSRSLI
ncbi:MAG: ATP-binding protein, partial [Actinobacteria bacterium]|nr:ATP-binding protein [Actinomycetota bacterium]